MNPQRLLKKYWGSSGWQNPVFSQQESRLLLEAGLLKHKKGFSHEEAVKWAIQQASNVAKTKVASAFLYSLSKRSLEHRSSIGSYAHIHFLRDHEFERAEGFYSSFCKVCGFQEDLAEDVDFGVLSFEKYKWGGVRHNNIIYAAFDLEQFSNISEVTPLAEDIKIFSAVIDAARESTSYTVLKKSISKLLKSNDPERSQLIHILSYIGIIQPLDCPSLHESHIDWCRRGDGNPKSDMEYPLGWWRGHEVNDKAIDYWFADMISSS